MRIRQNLMKTLFIHIFLAFLLCYCYQGVFLFFYPPLLSSWIVICLVYSLAHIYVHQKIKKHFFKDDLIGQIWLNPLLFIAIFTGITISLFSLSITLDKADFVRQNLQLSSALFSKFLYVHFLIIFFSGTYLFADLFFGWFPKLQRHHFSERNRVMVRKAYLIMSLSLVGGSIYIVHFKPNNLVYIGAVISSNFNGQVDKAIELFQSISERDEELYYNSCYRIARLYQNYYRKYEKAIEYFDKVIRSSHSALKDDAVYQSLLCMFLSQASAEDMDNYLSTHNLQNSCLQDEAIFLLAKKWESAGNFQKASQLYAELIHADFYSFTLIMFQNSSRRDFRRTRSLAEELLLEINTRNL